MNTFINIFTCSGIVYGIEEKYDVPLSGHVNSDTRVNVRTDAGTTYPILKSHTGVDVKLYNGHEVTVTGSKEAADGAVWYRIDFKYTDGSVLSGYMHGDYVKIDSEINYDPDKNFEKYLEKQKFPESYKPYLRNLHAKYPKWVFVADMLDYDWEDAINNQNKLGRSLISINAISSWKSVQQGAFDWKNNKWVSFDGTSWAAASRELIAYCMDPRNFLDENYIFQFELLSFEDKYQNIDGVNSIIEGTFMEKGLVDGAAQGEISYAQALMDAARESGVSPFHLAASIIQEQGSRGASGSISGTVSGYEKIYNYFNWGAYAANGNNATINGLIYASADEPGTLRPWNTRYASIIGGAKKLGTSYINIGQDTLYYKKFDYVGTPYTHQYMTHILAPGSEAFITSKAYTDDMKSGTSIIFKIPIYQNMPENPVPCPAGDGNPNNYLKSLSVEGQDMTPTFSYDVTDYNIVAGSGTKSIKISCAAIDAGAVISGAGETVINPGTNNIVIAVKAGNGSVRNYNLTVIKEEEPGEITGDIGLSSDIYTVDDMNLYITGIEPQTGAEQFLKNITCGEKGELSLLNSNLESHGGNVGTGNILMFKNTANEVKKYVTVVFGDINGDGIISLPDAIMLQKHILNISELKGVKLYAGDVNRKDGITLPDAIMLQKHILNIQAIPQKG